MFGNESSRFGGSRTASRNPFSALLSLFGGGTPKIETAVGTISKDASGYTLMVTGHSLEAVRQAAEAALNQQAQTEIANQMFGEAGPFGSLEELLGSPRTGNATCFLQPCGDHWHIFDAADPIGSDQRLMTAEEAQARAEALYANGRINGSGYRSLLDQIEANIPAAEAAGPEASQGTGKYEVKAEDGQIVLVEPTGVEIDWFNSKEEFRMAVADKTIGAPEDQHGTLLAAIETLDVPETSETETDGAPEVPEMPADVELDQAGDSDALAETQAGPATQEELVATGDVPEEEPVTTVDVPEEEKAAVAAS